MQYQLTPRSKMEDAPSLPKVRMSRWPKSWSIMEDPVVPLERNLYGLRWQDYYGEGNSRKSFWITDEKKFQIGIAYSLTERKGYTCLCTWMMSKVAGKKQNINPTWKILMKDVDLGEPTSFLDHVSLGCTQRECKISNEIQRYVRIQDFYRSQ